METVPSKKVVQPRINKKRVGFSRGFPRERWCLATRRVSHSTIVETCVAYRIEVMSAVIQLLPNLQAIECIPLT